MTGLPPATLSQKSCELPCTLTSKAGVDPMQSDKDPSNWISNLCDDVILRILSLLTMKEAAATSVLSKKWKYMWIASLNRLVFYEDLFSHMEVSPLTIVAFEKMVDNVVHHFPKSMTLKEFCVSFYLYQSSETHINEWLDFACRAGTTRVELNLVELIKPAYSVPIELFHDLNHGNHFSGLRELFLIGADMSDQVFEAIITTCASLECLVVAENDQLLTAKCNVPHMKLKRLTIDCRFLDTLEIVAPNLASFSFWYSVFTKTTISIEDARCLVNLNILTTLRKDYVFGQFSAYISQLQFLTLDTEAGSQFLQIEAIRGKSTRIRSVRDSEPNDDKTLSFRSCGSSLQQASEEMSKMHAELDQKISEVKQGGEQVDDSERNMKRVTALPETENTNLKASEEMSKMHAELDQKISEVKQGGEQVDDSERNMKRVTALPETENTNLKASEEMSKMHAELDQKISEVKQGGEQVDDSERNMKRVTALPETENTNLKASEEMSKMHAELDQKISVVKCPQSELSRQGVTQCPPNPSTIDRISELPNDALVYILSLMGTREAIRTSVLSKQWKGLWTKTFNLRHTFNLCFYDSSVSSPTTSTLQRILSLHRAPMIKHLYLDQIDDGVWRHEAELLVSYAAERHVMFVELKSGYWCAPFQIPDGLLRNSSLRGLSIEYCNLFATTWVRWELLMYLHIFHSTLKDIEVVLSGCPCLESLKLYEVRLHNNFLIDHKKLKEMWMVGPISSREDEEELEVRVMAPNLTRLVINGEWEGISLLLIDVPALVYTCWDLNFQNVYLLYDNHVDGIQSVKGCFEMVRHCKELCLGSHFQKLIREVETDPFRAIISSWECVVIESVLLGDIDLLVPRVLNLLHHTPNLKRLVVVFSDGNDFALLPNDDFSFAIHPPDDNQFYGVDDWMLRTDLSPDHFFSMVKKIEIHGVIVSQKWLEFVEFLLKYSNVLEQMVIYSSQANCQASSFLKVVEVLRSFPVSSRRAKVILDRNPVKKRDYV